MDGGGIVGQVGGFVDVGRKVLFFISNRDLHLEQKEAYQVRETGVFLVEGHDDVKQVEEQRKYEAEGITGSTRRRSGEMALGRDGLAPHVPGVMPEVSLIVDFHVTSIFDIDSSTTLSFCISFFILI